MGCGKTTIGKLLSSKLGWRFADGDDYHPEENREKMRAGIPLDDEDRLPWLRTLQKTLQTACAKDEDMILACSALKRSYRRILGIDQDKIRSIYLKGTAELLQKRIASRTHEYMHTSLLTSQLDTVEAPETGVIVNIDTSPEEIVEVILRRLSVNTN
jgi:carbohydrate kinase (thermoresistant glucokinase family)